MASLSTKVKKYLEANGKSSSEIGAEGANVQLVNEGSGDIIKVWTVSGLAKPPDDQLNSYETAGNTDETNNTVRRTRQKSYGEIGDQLDLLYKDMAAGKGDSTGEWFKAVKKVKDDNPKS